MIRISHLRLTWTSSNFIFPSRNSSSFSWRQLGKIGKSFEAKVEKRRAEPTQEFYDRSRALERGNWKGAFRYEGESDLEETNFESSKRCESYVQKYIRTCIVRMIDCIEDWTTRMHVGTLSKTIVAYIRYLLTLSLYTNLPLLALTIRTTLNA